MDVAETNASDPDAQYSPAFYHLHPTDAVAICDVCAVDWSCYLLAGLFPKAACAA